MANMEGTPKELFKVEPCKAKKSTKHEKGKPLTLPNRKGKVTVKYIEEARKRRQVLSTRRLGLFKKAYELNKLTGKYVKLQVGEDFWCSENRSSEETPSTLVEENRISHEDDYPLLSPTHVTV